MSMFEAICRETEAGRTVQVLTLVEVPLGEDGLGDMMVICEDGHCEGRLASEEVSALALEQLSSRRWEGPQVFVLQQHGGAYRVFWNRVGEDRRQAIILGGGHISQPLAQILHLLEYAVTVVDDRPEFADFTRFPAGSRVLCRAFSDVWPELSLTPQTALIIVTRGHRHDLECLRQALGSRAGYIGMIGSRRKVAGALTALAQAGSSIEQLSAVHAPIGLDIGAQTPAEIAVSIAAEVVAVFNEADAVPLAAKRGEPHGSVAL